MEVNLATGKIDDEGIKFLLKLSGTGLRIMLLDEFDTIKFDYRRPSNYNTFYLMKNFPELKYYDIVSTEKTENLSDIINLSFELMKDSIDNWKKSNSIEHHRYTYN